MANLCKWLMVMLFLPLFSVTLVSCGNDDEPDDKPNSGGSISDAASPFVGYWKQNASTGRIPQYFLFLADGTCHHSFYGYDPVEENGHWSYDPQTKMLTTDCQSYMWEISLVSPDSWAGFGLKYSKSDSYTRLSDLSAFGALFDMGRYTNDNTKFYWDDGWRMYYNDKFVFPNNIYKDLKLGKSDLKGYDWKLYYPDKYVDRTYVDIKVNNLYGGKGASSIKIRWEKEGDAIVETLTFQ